MACIKSVFNKLELEFEKRFGLRSLSPALRNLRFQLVFTTRKTQINVSKKLFLVPVLPPPPSPSFNRIHSNKV